MATKLLEMEETKMAANGNINSLLGDKAEYLLAARGVGAGKTDGGRGGRGGR